MNVSIAMEEDAADDVGAPVMDENDIEEDEEEEGGAQVKKKKKKGINLIFFRRLLMNKVRMRPHLKPMPHRKQWICQTLW